MASVIDRYKKLSETNFKFFYHDSFDQPSQRVCILSDMPMKDEYIKNQEKIHKMRADKVNPEMLPCYQSPLLSHEQEKHLFRQMNFLKYRAHKVVSRIMPESPSPASVRHAEHLLSRAISVRNSIAEANFRLATMIMKHRGMVDAGNSEQVLSDAYFDVLKATEYFNWTLGIKFSTYATWVVKKNFFRELKTKSTNEDRYCALDEAQAGSIEDRSAVNLEKSHLDRKVLIRNLIGMLVRENIGTDRVRQAYVLENYFGINGKTKKTLEQISEEIGVTKERIRQLKEKGIEWIQEKVRSLGLEYDHQNPGDSIMWAP